MTDNQQRAIDAIKKATGWDAEPSSQGAKVQRPNVTSIYVWWSRSDKWKCEITPKGWTGEGTTPEEAIDAVLPRYRAQIERLAADILPGWPRLEWQRKPGWRWSEWALLLVVGGVGCPLLTVGPYRQSSGWWLTYAADPRACVTSGTREKISAAVAAHVESLALPCPLPPFPETPDAT